MGRIRPHFEPRKGAFRTQWDALWALDAERREALRAEAHDFIVDGTRDGQVRIVEGLAAESREAGVGDLVGALNVLATLAKALRRTGAPVDEAIADLAELDFLPEEGVAREQVRDFLTRFMSDLSSGG